MSHYVWDLGFDFNAVVGEGGHSFLQNGFVSLQGTYNEPTNPIGIQLGDVIGFNAFNVTPGAETSSYSIKIGSIHFSNAVVNQEALSPFKNEDLSPRTVIPIGPLGTSSTSPSVIFSAATDTRFPFFHLVGPLTVATNGKFLMRVQLEVSGPDGSGGTRTQTFVVDPEMVVGSVG